MKKVFVALANKEYISYSKSLFYNVKDKWDGDFLLMVPEEDKDSYDFTEFTDRGIEVFFAPTILECEHPDFYKFYLFTEYFTKWDWIFYSDLDVLFFNKIDLKLEERDKSFYAKEDGLPFEKQFDKSDIDIIKKFNKEKSFQACYMLINPKDMVKDNMFDKLMNYYYEYHVFHNITNELTLAQSILNIPINWYDLGKEFINFYDRHEELNWDSDLLKKDFNDDRDYFEEGIISVHFGRFSAQWEKNNLKFYPIWKEYNDKF
jgi:lipopolysaccharide biosynthesis glycosyltransferase